MSEQTKPSGFQRFIMGVERAGAKIPTPTVLYFYIGILVVIISALLGGTEFSVPGVEGTTAVQSLLTREGVAHMLGSLFTNFTGLSIVGMMMAFGICVGIGDTSGFYTSFITKLAGGLPEKVVIAGYIFVCVNGNLISDAAIVLLPPLGAMLFQARGRNPLLGVIVTHFGYNGGLSANVLLASTDANVSAVTIDALELLPMTQNIEITMMSNWYFMFTSVWLLVIVGTLVATKITEPILDRDPEIDRNAGLDGGVKLELDAAQKKGLRVAGIVALALVVIILIGVLPANGILRNTAGGLLPRSPFMSSIPQILCLFFAIVGAAYGFGAGTMKKANDIVDGCISGLKGIAPILVTFFVAAQFINYLTHTNLASLFAIKGATLLTESGMGKVPMIIGLLILTCIVNFFIGSVSSKWAMLGPIFVPMFALLDFHPAFTQAIYRVGDALTNPINPIATSLVVVIGYAQRYKKSAGVGTIIAHELPYFMVSFLAWGVMLILWYLLRLPLGPGAGILMP